MVVFLVFQCTGAGSAWSYHVHDALKDRPLVVTGVAIRSVENGCPSLLLMQFQTSAEKGQSASR